jgi:hypothetical protein
MLQVAFKLTEEKNRGAKLKKEVLQDYINFLTL